MKRVATIHDISGFGKCSLTVAIPILSAAGIEVCPMPTAVLSTHTGGFDGFTFRDLTQDLIPFADHWKSLGIEFAAIYTGFLGSAEQIGMVAEIIDKLAGDDTLIFIDPVMGDHGELYKIFDKDMSDNMGKLAQRADILIPNMTEAAFILKEEFKEAPYTEKYISRIATALSDMGPSKIVLTGVGLDEEHLGAACFDKETGVVEYHFSNKIAGIFHGTGDVFASFLLAAILNNKTLNEATKLAVELTYDSIVETQKTKKPAREGVDFEKILPKLIREVLP
jgi:pyridoxine kinase